MSDTRSQRSVFKSQLFFSVVIEFCRFCQRRLWAEGVISMENCVVAFGVHARVRNVRRGNFSLCRTLCGESFL